MIYELERGACGFYLIHACARVVVAPSSLLRKHDMTDKEMAESIMRNEYETLIDKGFEGSWQVYQSAWIKATSYADYIHTCMPPAIAQPVQPTNWQPIETARRGKKLIVGYFNKLGNWRTVMACYYEPRTLNCDDDNIADEDGYAPEGWYEESETQETILPTDEPPTHWMQLPSAPDKANIAQPVQPAAQDAKDAERLHWLCSDMRNGPEKRARDALLTRMCVMTYSAICAGIDAELLAAGSKQL